MASKDFYEYFVYGSEYPLEIPKNILMDNKITTDGFMRRLGGRVGYWRTNRYHAYTYKVRILESGIWVSKRENDLIDFSTRPTLDIGVIRKAVKQSVY